MPNIDDTVTTPDGTCTVHLFTPDGRETQGPWPGVSCVGASALLSDGVVMPRP